MHISNINCVEICLKFIETHLQFYFWLFQSWLCIVGPINKCVNSMFFVVTEKNFQGRVDGTLQVKLDFVCHTIAVWPDMFVVMATEEEEQDRFSG